MQLKASYSCSVKDIGAFEFFWTVKLVTNPFVAFKDIEMFITGMKKIYFINGWISLLLVVSIIYY